jgi:hypothetical protein
MKIVRDTYNNRSRWRGVLNGQTVNSTTATQQLVGVSQFLSDDGGGLAVSDLFNARAVTGYYGDVYDTRIPSAITKANPGVVTDNAHGRSNGDRVKFFVNDGMTELNAITVVVTNKATNTFELYDTEGSPIDTSGYGNWSAASNRNYYARATIFDLRDDSAQANIDDDVTYPTAYTLAAQVLAESWRTGTASWEIGTGGTFTTFVSLSSLVSTYWPAHKTIADANGLSLEQYEGQSHFVGSTVLAGFGGNAEFNDIMYGTAFTQEAADVFAKMCSDFLMLGGTPSKFFEAGPPLPSGTWGGIRVLPGDEENPLWLAVRNANDGSLPHERRVNWAA